MKKLIIATSTPLASIFGSGFLVIVPVLHGAVGKYAVLAMVGVCVLAYCVGHAIRFNIRHAEPLLENDEASRRTKRLERSSDLALVGAYVISVCLYINILASFLLGGLSKQADTPFYKHLLTAVIILGIAVFAYFKGLKMLERLEAVGLWVSLLIVVLMFVGFGVFDLEAAASGIHWPRTPRRSWWEILTILGGTLIVVQGFETSRYLGEQYDEATRIQSCRLSQIISSVVYIVFVALATPLMYHLTRPVKDNELIVLAGQASVYLPIPLVCAAVLSQFSAALADTLGGSGNVVEATHEHVSALHANLLICAGALVLAFFPTLTILALASRAFAFYYMLQCLIAFSLSKTLFQKVFFLLIALVLAFITLFAVPVE
ncbi:hypothetical protein Pan153_36010 [Gimesia panareensis]|uniref:Uncharacterized protein n=1 Tax=Gimesia panareensis TaxID=2527978 RepID=A0A518FRM6_9PLAN|nr:hypothetical protein [Gimesia panareensis]QDV18940.1 hypothetical protein Pan153_36010 [Gimesia panareensis]